ncbi:hypothetical protein O3M35_001420 [Rhynocoris fuscipes]|uniref:Uncharacterized protein n=1 Tax=Rhynocoris fuscipes TaxID=488301 RepID=A0AAW1CRB6_9HEMI
MKIQPCCWVSLESSRRVLFNAIKKKKIPPLADWGGFHPHVRTILNPKFQYSMINRS